MPYPATFRRSPVSPTKPFWNSCLQIAATLSVLAFSCLPAFAGQSNSLMDISTDGSLLACSNRDSGTVTIVDLATHKVVREIKVGKHPEGVTFLGDSHRLAVAVYDEDRIVFVEAKNGGTIGVVDVFDEPYGVVSTRDGSRVYATLDYPGKVVEISASTRKLLRTFDAGSFVRGIALTPDDSRILVTQYYSAVVAELDVKTGETVDSWKPASTDNIARQITVHPSRPKAYLPHMRSRVTAALGEGSIFPYVGVVDRTDEEGRRRKRIPMDAFLNNRVTANPWEVAISPDGRRFYVVFAGTDDMFACDVIDDDYREIGLRSLMPLGRNPRAVKITPDGSRFYVYNALDFEVVGYSSDTLRKLTTVAVTQNPLPDDVLLGKILFYSALQPMVGRRWISCASCHPDGQPDGATWQNPEGLRNTPPLAGLAWTHPQHWSADRDETQDFEHTIRGPLMQGRGLIRGPVNASLGKPNKGLSKELDAVAAYTNSHKFTLSPHAKNGLSESAQRGRDIFLSDSTRCAECHSGPFYADSQSGKPSRTHDVGTGNDDPSEKMGPKYDTPTLLGIYRSAPYLHHGKAATLKDVLTTQNTEDLHGRTSQLKPDQIEDLVEFLKSLPYEDPEPAAKAAGIVKIRN